MRHFGKQSLLAVLSSLLLCCLIREFYESRHRDSRVAVLSLTPFDAVPEIAGPCPLMFHSKLLCGHMMRINGDWWSYWVVWRSHTGSDTKIIQRHTNKQKTCFSSKGFTYWNISTTEKVHMGLSVIWFCDIFFKGNIHRFSKDTAVCGVHINYGTVSMH